MKESDKIKFEKVYIEVTLIVRSDGEIRPRSILWEDGKHYSVERVVQKTPAASLKVGGRGNRYTVVIDGRERYLFDEDGRWFVEARRA